MAQTSINANQKLATTSNVTFNALTLSTPLSPANGGTGVNNGTSTLTLAGNLATSGAFASTFIMTAPTTVTFPTSGTLATTSEVPTITVTQHAICIGGAANAINSLSVATNGQIPIGSTGADPVLAVPTNGNNITWTTGAGSLRADVTGTSQHAVQIGSATGSLSSLAVATNGQLVIGLTGADPVVANITSTDGSITITNGPGSINLATVSSLTYSDQASTFAAATDNGYFCTGTLTVNLPAIAAEGMTVEIIAATTNIVTVTANGGDTIQIANANAGSFQNALKGDTLTLVAQLATTTWFSRASNGSWS